MSSELVGIALNNGSHIWYARQVEAERRLLEGAGCAVTVTDAEDDPDTQITQICQLVDDGAFALVVSATRSEAIDPALEYCSVNEVPVVAESVHLHHRAVRAQVRADDLAVGRKLGRAVGADLPNDGPLDVLSFGFPTLDEANRREWGFVAGLREQHPDVVVVCLDSRAQVSTARHIGHRWATSTPAPPRHPRVVLGVDDEALCGGLQGLGDAGIDTSGARTATFGISPPPGPQRLDDGTISFGAAMFPELHGTILAELVLDLLAGNDVDESVAPPAAIVTASGTARSWTRFYRREGDAYDLDVERARAES